MLNRNEAQPTPALEESLPLTPGLRVSQVLRNRGAGADLLRDWTGEPRTAATYLGSGALALAARILKQAGRSRLLVPSYHCGHEIEPFLRAGFAVETYRIKANLEADLEHLDTLLSVNDSVVLITHYFGFAQDVAAISRLCRQRGAYLVEDCAHCLLNYSDNRRLGSWGDIAVFSFRKFLPVPDGGMLVVNNPDLADAAPSIEPGFFPVWRKTLKLIVDRIVSEASARPLAYALLRSIKGLLLRLSTLISRSTGDSGTAYYSPDDLSLDYDSEVLDWSQSSLSKRILGNFDLGEICERRRANYRYVSEALADTKWVQPLRSRLEMGECPLHFPLVIEAEPDTVDSVMADYPLLYRWWSDPHPRVESADCEESARLRQACFILSIHQDLEPVHLDALVRMAYEADSRLVAVVDRPGEAV
jgi:dTDP-4-amino-4,6-dideoxygalactose transaminase